MAMVSVRPDTTCDCAKPGGTLAACTTGEDARDQIRASATNEVGYTDAEYDRTRRRRVQVMGSPFELGIG